MSVIKIILGQLKFFRRHFGGTWARTTSRAEVGKGLWLPYTPIDMYQFHRMVEDGFFDYEDYR